MPHLTRTVTPRGSHRARVQGVCTFLLALSFLFSGVVISDASARQFFPNESSITGSVRDAAGLPLAGAFVAIQTAGESVGGHLVVTDRSGLFSVNKLAAGEYLVRVTKSRFLPTVASNVRLESGARLVLTLNLQTALDVIRQGVRRGSVEEMKWILRSSPSARPVLHLTEPGVGGFPRREDEALESGAESAGYLQVYSTTVDSSTGASDAVGSEFSFSMPVTSRGQVTFAGQYTEAEDRPSGFTAVYDFSSGGTRSSVALNVRQGALLDGGYGSQAREIQVEYDEEIEWSNHFVFNYGATVGHTDGASPQSYLRPEVGFTWVPGSRNSVSVLFSRRAPVDASDPIRGREYFDRAVYVPPELEQYAHVELAATHVIADGLRVSIAGFRDEFGTQAFLVDSEDGRRGIVFFDGAGAPTTGVRVHVDRVFRSVEAGVGYTYANAVGFDSDVISPEKLQAEAARRNLHVVTARVKTEIPFTKTAVTAVYRWVSGFSLAPLDPYQRFAEYNDPTLSITVAQDLPSPKRFPGKLQAIVDARNLLEPSFGSRRTVYAGHPRLLKGGIHIRF